MSERAVSMAWSIAQASNSGLPTRTSCSIWYGSVCSPHGHPGTAFAHFIRGHSSHYVPVVLFSGLPKAEIRRAARQATADAWVRKGDGARLQRVVERHLAPHVRTGLARASMASEPY